MVFMFLFDDLEAIGSHFGSFLGPFGALFSLFGSLGRLGGWVLGSRGVILGTCGPKWDQVWKKGPNTGLRGHPFWAHF